MSRLRVLALMHEDVVPPPDATGETSLQAGWKTEFDVVNALHDLGHDVQTVGLGDDLRVLRLQVDSGKPHIVFNLMEHFFGVPIFDQNVVSYLELLRTPYTGCNPRGLILARDKGLSKQLLSYHRVPVPEFVVIRRGRKARRPKRLDFPLIVKSLTYEASTGIAQASVVDDDARLRERVQYVHERIGGDAIVERYIDGRELYVGVLGNQRLEMLPVWEMLFDRMGDGNWPIATDRAKWNSAYQERHGIHTERAQLSTEQIAYIYNICRRAYRALGLNGYARIDLRADAGGKLYVLEANPNPQLAYGEDFAESADTAGIEYAELIQRILNLGLRWRPELRG